MLVAPLDWGLGHATRCIPVIRALEELSYEPIVAGSGASLALLRNEFPKLKHYELPGCEIAYSKHSRWLFSKLLLKLPCFLKNFFQERKIVKHIIKKEGIAGIISDNRFGVYSTEIPSVYISHQITVFSGLLTPLTTALHSELHKNFDECWVPDSNKNGLSGKLGHPNRKSGRLKYMGLLSRFSQEETKGMYDILILLSGPEPQRTLLEEKLIRELKNYKRHICLIRGTNKGNTLEELPENWDVCELLLSEELQHRIASSKMVLTRSGYSTLMDMAAMKKKVFLIPTPGQFEQEYLAHYLEKKHIAPYCRQEEFHVDQLRKTNEYQGFNERTFGPNLALFKLFECK